MANDLGFIDPTAGGGKAKIAMAPRSMALAGKVVGLLDNTKEQADIILQTIGDALREHLRGRLAGFKIPKVLRFDAELPREDNGKIYKRRISDPYWQAAGRRI